jgi:hypothetical protein
MVLLAAGNHPVACTCGARVLSCRSVVHVTMVPCVHWSGCPEEQDMARRCGRSIGHVVHADTSSLLRRFGRATRRCAEKVQQRMQRRPWRVLLAAPCPQRAAGDGGRHSSKDVVSRVQPGLAGPGMAPASCCWGRQWWSIPLCKHIGHLGRCFYTLGLDRRPARRPAAAAAAAAVLSLAPAVLPG